MASERSFVCECVVATYSQKFFQSFLRVPPAGYTKECTQNCVDSNGQAVSIVGMTSQISPKKKNQIKKK